MPDIEAQFIVRLLIGNKADKADFTKYPFDDADFRLYDREYAFIQSFEEKYGKLPDKATFLSKFPKFKIVRAREPLAHYADSIVERRNRGALMRELRKVEPLLNSAKVGASTRAILKIGEVIDNLTFTDASDVTNWNNDAKRRFRDYLKRKKRQSQGLVFDSPYPALNAMCPSGYVAGNLITIASRLAVGKTWLGCKFALHWLKADASILFISKEMSDREIIDRMDAIEARLNWIRFVKGTLKPIQRKRYRTMLNRVKKARKKMTVAADASLTETGLETLVQKIEQYRPDAVIVDGIAQFDGKGKGEVEKMLNISRRMKKIAKAKKIVLVQTVQMNRQAEGSKKGGGLGTISWSDAIGQDSDYVFELVAPDGRDKPERLFKNLKGRNSSFGEFWINMKVKPQVNFDQIKKGPKSQKKVPLNRMAE